MNGDQVDVSVVVPVRNERQVLAETAATILGQRFEGTLEFVFVDGESDDGSLALLRQIAAHDPRVSVLSNPARVEPAALNVGVNRARGTYVALLNAHCWYPEDYLALGVRRLRDGDASWVTGPAIPSGHGRFATGVAHALISPLGAGGSGKWRGADVSPEEEVDLDTGLFAGVVSRAFLLALGPFEENWVVNHDSEMASRVLSSGGRIVQLGAMGARYHPRGTPRGLWRQYWRFGFYRVKTAKRHPVALRAFHVAAGALTIVWLVAIVAPRRVALIPRFLMAGYGGVLVREVSDASAPSAVGERVMMGIALSIMHLGWGAGFVCGCLRFGLPMRGLIRILGPNRG